MAMNPNRLELSKETFNELKVSKLYQEYSAPISSISFDDSGETCLTTSQDDNLLTYDCLEGT
jgi:WD40 repeat protein